MLPETERMLLGEATARGSATGTQHETLIDQQPQKDRTQFVARARVVSAHERCCGVDVYNT